MGGLRDVILENGRGGAILVGDEASALSGLMQGSDILFNTIVFAAAERPPPYELLAKAPTQSLVHYIPLRTQAAGTIPRGEIVGASQVAELVMRLFRSNRPVLITSSEGRHRATLIAALAYYLVLSDEGEWCDGATALAHVRQCRQIEGPVLTNPSVVSFLQGMKSLTGGAANEPLILIAS